MEGLARAALTEALAHRAAGGLALLGGDDSVVIGVGAVERLERPRLGLGERDSAVVVGVHPLDHPAVHAAGARAGTATVAVPVAHHEHAAAFDPGVARPR